MSYLLDTNVCIRFINGYSQPILEKLRSIPADDIFVCSVVKGEMFFGSQKSNNPERSLSVQRKFLSSFQSLPFDDHAAEYFGEIRAYLTRQGNLIGPYDIQIAAIALANDCTLVTHNVREFGRIANLEIEDWEG